MNPFFNTLCDLDQFTMELKNHANDLVCMNCHKCDQFVSHGYVYKKKDKDGKKIVGKRIFCSNRFGKSGCGCTLRFYLAIEIPKLKFNTSHLTVFLNKLFEGMSIEKSYSNATGTTEPRQAYRWLKKLDCKLIEYRQRANHCTQLVTQACISANKRVPLLFASLQPLLFNAASAGSSLGYAESNPCKAYQWQQQMTFL